MKSVVPTIASTTWRGNQRSPTTTGTVWSSDSGQQHLVEDVSAIPERCRADDVLAAEAGPVLPGHLMSQAPTEACPTRAARGVAAARRP